ncbi:MAG: hypothetical protein WC769_01600 [Thermodesulfovibrionales bacterium]|jgi:hypothetical protein
MLKLPIAALNAIRQGVRPKYKVRVHFQAVQDFTEDDYLQSIGQMRWSMSKDGLYEITNGTITLKNIDYYFSRFFNREQPGNKRVEIYLIIDTVEDPVEVLWTSAVVKTWKLTPMLVTLEVNA